MSGQQSILSFHLVMSPPYNPSTSSEQSIEVSLETKNMISRSITTLSLYTKNYLLGDHLFRVGLYPLTLRNKMIMVE